MAEHRAIDVQPPTFRILEIIPLSRLTTREAALVEHFREYHASWGSHELEAVRLKSLNAPELSGTYVARVAPDIRVGQRVRIETRWWLSGQADSTSGPSVTIRAVERVVKLPKVGGAETATAG